MVNPDWTVDTGHDEELERIAVALGGGVSCLPALAGVIPAFRLWWLRATRQAGLPIRSDDEGRHWHCADGRFGCCPAAGFLDPSAAAAHAREAGHVSAATGAARSLLIMMVAALGPAADPPAPDPVGAGGPSGELIRQAWAAGIPPEEVQPAWQQFATCGHELDLPALLGLAQGGADPRWVLDTAAALQPRGRSGLLAWLAWTATDLDLREPGARADWVAAGTRRGDVLTLSGAGYEVAAAAQIATTWGVSIPGAAQVLARWVASGYRPHPAHLASLRDVGLSYPPGPPAPAAVDRLASLIGERAHDEAQRTGLALAIARHGTMQGAAVALVQARGRDGRGGHRCA